MAMFCNFGENELPRTTQEVRELDISKVETFADFNWTYANYEMTVARSVECNPILQKKVDGLCDNYDAEQLAFAMKDLEWKILSTRRGCHDALSGGNREVLLEQKAQLEQLTVQKAVLDAAKRRIGEKEP